MLVSLEKVYLGILRVVILILATLALIVTVGGLTSATPEFLRWSGFSQSEKPTGGTLGEFIAEQKVGASMSAGDQNETSGALASQVLPAIKSAVANISKYPGVRVDQASLTKSLQQKADSTQGHGEEYAGSLRGLTDELVHSTGSPLSAERVGALIDWHHDHFMADLAVKESEQTTSQSRMMLKLGFSASAFLAFILMIFVFIFVKIERNLRVIKSEPLQITEHD
jgi:hypothetical protein